MDDAALVLSRSRSGAALAGPVRFPVVDGWPLLRAALISDVLPIFIFFLIPAFLWLRLGEPHRLLSVVFYFSVLISVLIHFRGARYWAPYEWNGNPSEVSIERAWDWRDP